MGDLTQEFLSKNVGGIDWINLTPAKINQIIDGANDIATLRLILKKMALVLWFYMQQEVLGR